MTADGSMTGQVGGFQNRGICLQAFPSFFPTPPRSFTCAIFYAVFYSTSSFFAHKPHRNACYAGYSREREKEKKSLYLLADL